MSERANPTLAYMYRRHLARQLLPDVAESRFLEIGIGRGTFYTELEDRGWFGLGLDLNPDLIREHQRAAPSSRRLVQFRCLDFFALVETFDLIIGFEVLEHYQDDEACLSKWAAMLNPRGTLIFSVPAHMRQWTRNDTQAGHARRYEKAELKEKLQAKGFEILQFWCYGFPLLNITYRVSQWLSTHEVQTRECEESPSAGAAESKERETVTSNEKPSERFMHDFAGTARSGTRRFQHLSRWVFHEKLWWPFLLLQKTFLLGDLGTGYLVKCQKK